MIAPKPVLGRCASRADVVKVQNCLRLITSLTLFHGLSFLLLPRRFILLVYNMIGCTDAAVRITAYNKTDAYRPRGWRKTDLKARETGVSLTCGSSKRSARGHFVRNAPQDSILGVDLYGNQREFGRFGISASRPHKLTLWDADKVRSGIGRL